MMPVISKTCTTDIPPNLNPTNRIINILKKEKTTKTTENNKDNFSSCDNNGIVKC